MRGAGGTQGGIGQFFIGFIMLCGGLYLFLDAVTVRTAFTLSYRIYSFSALGGNYGVTGGIILIPFMLGIGLIFYDGKSIVGWLLATGAIAALVFGIVSSISFSLRTMSAFELITILVLCAGGLGLFLRSLKTFDT
ncbi:MAG: hypothetical protein ACU84J_06330 [Gammaproteobacteria bacterium]